MKDGFASFRFLCRVSRGVSEKGGSELFDGVEEKGSLTGEGFQGVALEVVGISWVFRRSVCRFVRIRDEIGMFNS